MSFVFLFVNFNMKGLLRQCLESVRENAGDVDNIRFLIADNSTDPTFRIDAEFEAEFPNADIIHLPENKGWINALNVLLPMADCDYTVIMHPDVKIQGDTLAELKKVLCSNPAAAVVSPDIVYPNGRPCEISIRFPTIRSELKQLANEITQAVLKRELMTTGRLWDHRGTIQTDMVMSIFMLFRTEALHKIGVIPERLYTYYGNDYMCAQAGKLGMTCHYTDRTKVVHYERYADTSLYSPRSDSKYKGDNTPASPRMEPDRINFLRTIRSRPSIAAFKSLRIGYCVIEALRQLKSRNLRGARQRIEAIRNILLA